MLWQFQKLRATYKRRILAEARRNTGLIDVGMPWSGLFTQGKAAELALVKHRENDNYLARNPYFSDSKGLLQILPDDAMQIFDSISYDSEIDARYIKDEKVLKQAWADAAKGAFDFSNNVILLFENADVDTILHESFHYFNSFLKNPEFKNNQALENEYFSVLEDIKADISTKYKIFKSEGRYYMVNKETYDIMPELQRGFNSSKEVLDAAAEEIFVKRMVLLFKGKKTIGAEISGAADLYRTWLNKLISGLGISTKTSGDGGKKVLNFLRHKLK